MRRMWPGLVGVVTVCAAGAATPARADTLPAATTTLVSVPSLGSMPSGGVGDSQVHPRGTSEDGRYVVFTSNSDSLLPAGVSSRHSQVFWLDRLNGTLRLVSAAADGTPGDDVSFGASITADGGDVVFSSAAKNLTAANTTGQFGVFLRAVNPSLGSMRLMSRVQDDAPGGVAGSSNDAPTPGGASGAVISADGSQVVFASDAPGMGAGISGNVDRIYRRNTTGFGATVLVTRDDDGAPLTADAFSASPSEDGRYVAFSTTQNAIDAEAVESNGLADVYLRDMTSAETIWASPRTNETATTTGGSSQPSVSGDGTRVAFRSDATDLSSATDANGEPDVYLRNRTAGTTTLISAAPGGAAASGRSVNPSISAAGTRVAFISEAGDLVAGITDANGEQDAFVRELSGPVTRLLSRTPDGTTSPGSPTFSTVALSLDGTAAAFDVKGTGISDLDDDEFQSVYATATTGAGPVSLLSRPPGATGAQFGGVSDSFSGGGTVSADGRFVAFTSSSDGLDPAAVDRRAHGYVRDVYLGTTTLVDRAGATGPVADGTVGSIRLSSDGTHVAFTSDATNLDPADTTDDADVYVRNLATGATMLVSRASGPDGAKATTGGVLSGIDADGSRVAFSTPSTNLGAGEDPDTDIFVRDMPSATTILASRANGADGASADQSAGSGTLDATGNRVMFHTTATNLANGDGDATRDAHVRDIAAGTTTLVSRRDGTDGAKFANNANGTRLSADGTIALFTVEGGADVGGYVRNLITGTTVRATRADGADGAVPSFVSTYDLSSDGNRVLFGAFDGSLTGEAPVDSAQVYLRDIPTSRTLLVSRDSGATGSPIARSNILGAGGLSGNGRCATFLTYDRLGASPYPTSDFLQVYLRAIDGECAPAPVPGPAPGTTPTPTPPVATPAADTVRPVLDRFTMTRRRFAVARRATALTAATRRKRAPKGTAFRLRLSERATVRITIRRELSGRRRGRSCVKPTARLRRAKRCTRLVTRGTLTRRSLAAGTRSIAFSGRLGRKALARGAYRATATATDAARNRSARARTARFTIVRP